MQMTGRATDRGQTQRRKSREDEEESHSSEADSGVALVTTEELLKVILADLHLIEAAVPAGRCRI